MSITVLLPRTLMSVAGGQRTLLVEPASCGCVTDVLDSVGGRYPLLARRIRDETGAVRRYVNVYLDGEDIRQLDGIATAVGDGQQLRVIQSVASG